IAKAGLKPWPKLFHNLRATRETELAETYPLHVVCSWIGNTQAVAAKHYLQVTDAHFDAARKATRNPAQHTEAHRAEDSTSRDDSEIHNPNAHEKTPGKQGYAA